MLNCPFCGYDYSEVGLRDSRCRNCGSVLAWDDGQDNLEPLPVPKITVPTSSTQYFVPPPLPAKTTEAPLSGGPSNQPDAHANNPLDNAFKTRTFSEDENHFGEPPPDNDNLLTALWGEPLIEPSTNPLMTIKGQTANETRISDSVLSIQSRNVRRTSDEHIQNSDYELLEVIGEGGIGTVYSARQSSIDRNVAVKMLRSEYQDKEDHRDKFLAEAVVTGDLNHPNIVPIYDLGRAPNGELFYSMKRVIGTPWDKVIHTKSKPENLEILLKVADAIAFAHSRGVIHRDLKPENTMLGEFGEVLVMDWGIALPTTEFRKTASITRSLSMGGTPAYMAPEMAHGPPEKISFLSDVYLLGAILFEIVTGKPPHYGRNVLECVTAAANNVIQPTSEKGELLDIALRAMSTRPNARYPSVQAFQHAIREYQAHSESVALSDRAERELNVARETKNYEDYSRALFAFQEAYALWPSNDLAYLGIADAKMAYAETALAKGDLDLGLSLLDSNVAQYGNLRQKLIVAQKERDARQSRLQSVRRLVALLVLFIVVSGVSAFAFIAQQLRRTMEEKSKVARLNDDLKDNQSKLEEQILAVQEAQNKAKAEAQVAIEQKLRADAERVRADQLRLATVAAKQLAEERSYYSEIGLAGEKLASNAYGVARQIVTELQVSPTKSKLRHWEWGRYSYVGNGGRSNDTHRAVRAHECGDAIQSIAYSSSDFVLVGLANGRAEIWKEDGKSALYTLEHGRDVLQVAWSTNGKWIATAGTDDENHGSIRIWEWNDPQQPPRLLQALNIGRFKATSVAFSRDLEGSHLVVGDDERFVSVWRRSDGKRQHLCEGHFEAVTDVDVSYDGKLIASSSEDGTVRIWSFDDGRELQRFRGHSSAVNTVAFSPDQRQVASAGADQRILLWAINATQDQASLVDEVKRRIAGETIQLTPFRIGTSHTNAIRDLKFSSDGLYLVSASQDQTLCIWNCDAPEVNLASNRLRDQTLLPESPLTLVKTLRGHGGWVSAGTFGSNSQIVLSAGTDQEWRRWDLSKYAERRVFSDIQQPITNAEFLPSGDRLLIALKDGSLLLRDANTGEALGEFQEGHSYLASGGRFLNQGKSLLTYAGDNTIRIWDVANGGERQTILNAGKQGAVAISSDEAFLLAAGNEHRIHLWNLAEKNLLLTLKPYEKIIESFAATHTEEETKAYVAQLPETAAVAVTPGANFIFAGDSLGTGRLWDRNGRLLFTLDGHSSGIVWAGFLPQDVKANSSPVLVTASSDGTVAQWNASTGKELEAPRLKHGLAITNALLSDRGDILLTNCSLGKKGSRISVWNTRDGSLVKSKELEGVAVNALAYVQPDSAAALMTCVQISDARPSLMTWDWQTDALKPIGSSRMISASTAAALMTPDGKELLTIGGRGAKLWDATKFTEVMTYRPSSTIHAVAVTRDGKRVIAGAADSAIKIWNVEDRQVVKKLIGGHQSALLCLATNANGSLILSGGEDGRAILWTPEQSSVGELLAQFKQPVRCVALSRDEQLFFTSSEEAQGTLWNAQTRKPIAEIKGHQGDLTCAVFSEDGKWLLTGSQDKTAKVWATADGSLCASLSGHAASIDSVSFAADGFRILTASQDSTAKLWDSRLLNQPLPQSTDVTATIPELQEVVTLAGHGGEVTTARFSPTGNDVLTASIDKTLIVWPGDLVSPNLCFADAGIEYSMATGPLILDSTATVSEPSRVDWEGWQLRVWLDSAPGLHERLGIAGRTENLPVEITAANEYDLTVTLLPSASREHIINVLRALTYECEARSGRIESMERNVFVTLSHPAKMTEGIRTESKSIRLIGRSVASRIQDGVRLAQ